MINANKAVYNKKLDEVELARAVPNRIIRYFPDTHLGNGHQGLANIALNAKIDVKDLTLGEFVIFVNKSQTGLKMFASNNIVAYLKMPSSQKIDTRVIAMLPRFFNGSKINYDKALKEKLEKDLK